MIKTKERILFLTEKAKFSIDKEEEIRFEKDLFFFIEDIKLLDYFNLDNVEPLRKPFFKKEDHLRDDNIIENNSLNLLKNTNNSKERYIYLSNKKEEE